MVGQLVQVDRPSRSSTELIAWVEDWRQEVAELRAEVHRLERENLELRQQVGYWKSRHRDALARVTALEQKVDQLEGEKRQLQADLFGRRSETQARNDRSNDLDDPEDESHKPKRNRGQQPKNPGPKRRDYSHLPAREKFVELPPEQCVCPRCGRSLLTRGDTEDSEQIEIEVCAYRRVIRRRRYQRTCTCNGTGTLTAPAPPKLIPKGRYGISVWVEILLDKYFSYRPTERLLASWRLLGLTWTRDGHRRLERLEVLLRPIYQAIKERNPHGDLHQGDETRWPVFVILEGKEGYGWWLWAVSGRDTVVYLLAASRGHTVPENHYQAESRGVLVVDRYAAYKAMIWVKDGSWSWLCWSHVRRDPSGWVRAGWLKMWAL
jgi:transposase